MSTKAEYENSHRTALVNATSASQMLEATKQLHASSSFAGDGVQCEKWRQEAHDFLDKYFDHMGSAMSLLRKSLEIPT